MKYILVVLVLALTACNSPEPVPLTGDEPVPFKEFVGIFPELTLPYLVADSSIAHKDKDSLVIRHKLLVQFIPDSVLTRAFGKIKPKVFPLGRVKLGKPKADVTYLLVKTVAQEKKGVYLFAFDKKDKLIGFLPFFQPDNSNATQQSSSVNPKGAVYKNILRKNSDGTTSDGQDVFDLDPATGVFNLVFTDALDDKPTELVNPIDTVSRKQKFSADYGYGKTSLVSIRDGRRSDRIMFFMHIDNGKECTGELKGEAVMRSATMAEYRESGDPCAVQFFFTGTAVTVKELEGCGAHRSLRCSFNGAYAKKKVGKPKTAKIKK